MPVIVNKTPTLMSIPKKAVLAGLFNLGFDAPLSRLASAVGQFAAEAQTVGAFEKQHFCAAVVLSRTACTDYIRPATKLGSCDWGSSCSPTCWQASSSGRFR